MARPLDPQQKVLFANLVVRARLRRSMTQQEFAEACGVSLRTLQRIESLDPTIGVCRANVIRIAEAGEIEWYRFLSRRSARVIGVLSEKGGVGRTILCIHLAGFRASVGKRVLVLLTQEDSEGNIAAWSDRPKDLPHIDCKVVLPGGLDAALDAAHRYDYVFIDGSRSRPDLTSQIVSRADAILMPCDTTFNCATERSLRMCAVVEKRPPILLVANRVRPDDSRTGLNELGRLSTTYGAVIAETMIAERECYRRFHRVPWARKVRPGLTVFDNRPGRNQLAAAHEIASLAKEIERLL